MNVLWHIWQVSLKFPNDSLLEFSEHLQEFRDQRSWQRIAFQKRPHAEIYHTVLGVVYEVLEVLKGEVDNVNIFEFYKKISRLYFDKETRRKREVRNDGMN